MSDGASRPDPPFPSPGRLSRLARRWLGAGRTGIAYLNAAGVLLDYAARLLVGFVVNPFLVSGLGTYQFGLWQLLRQFVGWASPATGRPAQALQWVVVNRQASSDVLEKRRYVGSALAFWALSTPALAAIGGALAWWAPAWVDAPDELVWPVRAAAALLVAQLALNSLVQIPYAVLAGENLGYRRMGASALLVLLGGGLMIAAVRAGLGIVGVAAAPIVTMLLNGALYLRVVRRSVQWFGVSRPARGMVANFVGLSGWFLLWRAVMEAMRSSDLVVLGVLDSVEKVAAYSLTKYAPEAAISLLAELVFGVLPGLGKMYGSGDLERTARVRSEILALAWLVTSASGVTLLLWNRSFVALWVGAEHFVGTLETLAIVAMSMQFVHIQIDGNVLNLTLRMRTRVLLGGVSAALSVGAAAFAVGSLGLGVLGLCGGFMLGRALLTLTYPWLVGRALGVSLGRQLLGVVRPLLASIALGAAALALVPQVGAEGWLGLAFGAPLTGALALALASLIGLPRDQRRALLARLPLARRQRA